MKQELSERATELKPGIYQHYKGNLYQVLGVCRHSETLEEMVVYMAMYGSFGWWVRPLDMFMETVEKDGNKMERFKFTGQNR
jgi:cyclomaltodextrinase / maltogenic alpha-amylase / neopullulanase